MKRTQGKGGNMAWKKKLIEAVGLLIIAAGIVTSIRMNLLGRSLWWDEAALAYSFSTRDIFHLTDEALELIQSAPAGWLYLVKLLTLLLGNTDLVLRIPSFLAYLGILLLIYWILKTIFLVQYPVVCTAFAASFPLLLQYSNMFKPYISDGFFCLLAIVFFYQYHQGKRKPLTLGIFFGILVWFSNPVCFVAGGLILSEMIYTGLEKKWDKIIDCFKICMPLGISFVVYYFYWLRQTATDERMVGYWREWNFPLFPSSADDMEQIKKLIETIFSQFYRLEYIVLILLAVFFVGVLRRKGRILTGLYASFALSVFASGLGMFPVNKRLWLFMYPLVILILSDGMDHLIVKEEGEKTLSVSSVTIGLILMGCALLNGGIRYYWNEENVYWPGYEVKKEYEYLVETIKPGEQVYVFVSQAPIFQYYNQYDTTELADTGCRVLIGEHPLTEKYDSREDLDYITDAEHCYVVLGDTWDKKSYNTLLFPALHESGCFQMIYNEYETPLWYYCKNIKDSKVKVSYEIKETEAEGEKIVYEILLHNVGEAWLNPKFETLELVSEDGSQRVKLPKNIVPGDTVKLDIVLPQEEGQRFHLENEYGRIAEDTEVFIGDGE